MSSPLARAQTLRVAMLAPISWRVPPRAVRSVGAVRLPADGGTGRARSRRHAVRHRRLRHDARASSGRRRPATRRIRHCDAKVWEALHISAVFERAGEFDVIHNSFDFLPLTYSGLVGHPGRDDDPRVLVGADRARLREVQRAAATTSRSATPTGTSASTTSRRSITASTWASSSLAAGAGRLPPVLRSDPPGQGDGRGDRRRRARRHAAADRRDHPGPRLLRAARRAAPRRGARDATSARSDPTAAAACSAARRRSCTSSTSTSRSASASSRRWLAGRRSSRGDAARCPRSSATGRTASSSTSLDEAVAAVARFERARPGRRCAHRSKSASTSSGWWTTTSPSTSGRGAPSRRATADADR